MGKVVQLHRDQHREVQLLLPWFVTGQLTPDEQAQVEAHLVTCPDCKADLALDRGLAVEVANLPMGIELGWASMLRRLDGAPESPRIAVRSWWRKLGGRLGGLLRVSAPWLGWAMAAQLGLFVLVGVVSPPAQQPARYHTLAAAPTAAPGNVVVIFRPDTTERAIRQMLKADDARIVDGPTAAGAYVLRVSDTERPVALTRLKARSEVLLAEPIDPGERP